MDPQSTSWFETPIASASAEDTFATGILPSQELLQLIHVTKEIRSNEPLVDDQVQPASLDLRLGSHAFRGRASFLPGPKSTVAEKLRDLSMHQMDIADGGVLEKGCVYIVPLLESLALKHRMSALANPKSSTGRLDVFTRVITDQGTEFDRIREMYRGPLYAEIAPRTFSILVRKGSRLSQLRIRRGNPLNSDERLKGLQQKFQLVDRELSDDEIRSGVPITV